MTSNCLQTKDEENEWLLISIFSEQDAWHVALKNAVRPFLDMLSEMKAINLFNLQFEFEPRENIRLALLVPRCHVDQVIKRTDIYFTEFFSKQPFASIANVNIYNRGFEICTPNTVPLEWYATVIFSDNRECLLLQETFSQTMLEIFSDNVIDDSLILTFSLYILLGCYKIVPESKRLFIARSQFVHSFTGAEHLNGVEIDLHLIHNIYTELRTTVDEICQDIMLSESKSLAWVNRWKSAFVKIFATAYDSNQELECFKKVIYFISRQLGLSQFLIVLLNRIVLNTLAEQVNQPEGTEQLGKTLTMSFFGKFGRLGNQLFQYASLIGLATKFNTHLVMPSWEYAGYFNHTFPEGAYVDGYIIKETTCCYSDHWGSFDWNQPIDIVGYLQSEKYWLHCKDKVLRALEFKKELKERVKEKFDFSKPVIAIHIRRGDFVNHPNFAQLPISYFHSALNEFPQWRDCNIIIFSDDISYCRLHFKHIDNVKYSENNSAIEDLCLMAQCSNFIISNSTFSWWGAYLSGVAGENIIRPDCLYAGQYKTRHSDKDYWPASWRVFECNCENSN